MNSDSDKMTKTLNKESESGLSGHCWILMWTSLHNLWVRISDDVRSLNLTDILSWQTSSLHLSTNRMTYRSSTSSTFVLNTGFITLDISKENTADIIKRSNRPPPNSSWRFPKIICMIACEIISPEFRIISFRSLRNYFIEGMSDRTINYPTKIYHWLNLRVKWTWITANRKA